MLQHTLIHDYTENIMLLPHGFTVESLHLVVHQSNSDAGTLIVQCALQFAIEGSKVCCS